MAETLRVNGRSSSWMVAACVLLDSVVVRGDVLSYGV
jgi:hypothetical protein